MATDQEDPGAELIAELVGDPPLALPEAIDKLETAVEALEDEIQAAGEKAAEQLRSGKRGGKV